MFIIEVSVRMPGGLGMANDMKSHISHFEIGIFNYMKIGEHRFYDLNRGFLEYKLHKKSR